MMSYLDYSSQEGKNNYPDFLSLDHYPPWAIPPTLNKVQPRENESALSNAYPWLLNLDHSPPRAIPPALNKVQPGENEYALRNDYPDHFLRKWLSYTNLQNGPFPMLTTMGNHCLWYIINPSNHFHYENDRSIWTIFRTGKFLFVKNIKPLSELERNSHPRTFFELKKWLFINQ